jgi:hypothetical protein
MRKVMRGRAMLMLDGATPVHARTQDVGLGGVSLELVDSVQIGQCGLVSFQIFFGGNLDIITTRVEVMHCVCGSEGFKAGLQFGRLEEQAAAAIVNYLRRDWPPSARNRERDRTQLPFGHIITTVRLPRYRGVGAKPASPD